MTFDPTRFDPKIYNHKPDTRVPVNRPDGRPEVYDILADDAQSGCVMCQQTENHGRLYGKGHVFMCSPIDASDGQAHMVCLDHLPDNAVIYDPKSNLCRDKTGQNVWQEG